MDALTPIDDMDIDDFMESHHYKDSYANWCQDNQRVEAIFAGTDEYAEALGKWLREMAEP